MRKELIGGAANKLRPLHVHLRDFSVSLDDDYCPTDQDDIDLIEQGLHHPVSVSMANGAEANSDKENSKSAYIYHFIYEVATRSLYTSENDSSTDVDAENSNPKVALEILAKFDACYIASEKLDTDEMDAFAKYNVGFNVWPYWRELVGSVCSRIGRTPPINFPFYKMNEYQEEPQQLPGAD